MTHIGQLTNITGVHVCLHICLYVHLPLQVCVFDCVCVCMCMHACLCICSVNVCMFVFVCVVCVYVLSQEFYIMYVHSNVVLYMAKHLNSMIFLPSTKHTSDFPQGQTHNKSMDQS